MGTNIAKLTYRIYKDGDMEGVLQLWGLYSGWGAITEQQFNEWYINTPYGRCLIVVATNEEEQIVGQTVFIPTMFNINSVVVKAYRVSSPILNNSCHKISIRNGNHPAHAMFNLGVKIGKQQGYRFVYGFPAPGWIPLIKAFARYGLPEGEVLSYDCFSVSLEEDMIFNIQNIKISICLSDHNFNEEWDQLWNDTVKQFPMKGGVKRHRKWLSWKLKGQHVFEARNKDNHQLFGYVAIQKNSGLLIDMLARTKGDLEEILIAVIHTLRFSNPDRISIQVNKLIGMLSPVVQLAMQNIPFKKENFEFAFSYFSFNNTLDKEHINPADWYLMPND